MTATAVLQPTANDRLKRSFDGALGASLLIATGVHVLVFQFFPEMSAPSWDRAPEPTVEIVQMQEHDIPEAPQEFVRPAAPLAVADVPADATIAPIGFDEYVELPPPAPEVAADAGGEAIHRDDLVVFVHE